MRVEPKVHVFGAVRVDTRHWPLLVMEFARGGAQDIDFVRSLDFIETTWRVGEKSYQVTDLSAVTEAPANQRRIAANWNTKTAELQRRWSVGGSLVAPNPFVRGIITAVHWIKQPPTPTRVVATRDEGMVNGIDALEEVGVPLSKELLDLRILYRGRMRDR